MSWWPWPDDVDDDLPDEGTDADRDRPRWGHAVRAVGLVGALIAAGVLAASIGLTGCGDPPTKTIEAARTAYNDLKGAGGAVWAAEEFASAEQAVKDAESELKLQQARWFGRDYLRSFELFREAMADIDTARRASVLGRAAAEKEAREALEAAIATIDHARVAMMVAHVGREGRPAAARLDSGLQEAEARLSEIESMLEEERYKEALPAAEGVQERVATLLHAVMRAPR